MVGENKAYIVDPGKEFNKAIQDALKKVTDLTIPFQLMTQSWFKSNLSIFDMSRKGPGKYPVLGGLNPNAKKKGSSKTNRQLAEDAKMREVGFIYPLLVRSGKLANSMTQPGNENAVSQIINKTILILGTKAKSESGYPYPIALQVAGGKAPFRPRPHVLMGAEQVAEGPINKRQEIWLKIIEKHVVDKLNQIAKKKGL